MQNIMDVEINEAKRERMKKLDEGLKKFIQGSVIKERVICPKCNYQSKKNRCSAIIFKDSIKCFACGMWRRI